MAAKRGSCRVRDELAADYELPLRLYGVAEESIVDGPGLRFAVFVQGCSHHCHGCHNPESQPICGGRMTTVGAVCELIAESPSVTGVTLSGGEPFEQPEACAAIARWCKSRGLGVWAYSGYVYESLIANGPRGCASADARGAARDLLDQCDVLVDGPFVSAKKAYDLRWRGSSNQRVIDLARTRACGRTALWEERKLDFRAPENW